MPRTSDPNAKVKLLAAAEQVFVAQGLDRAKVEDIAARAGLAKGSFYLHFPSKEDAFRQLVEAMLARMSLQLDCLSEDCAGADLGSLLDQWVSQDAEVFEFVWQNRGLMGLLLEGGKCAAYRHLVDQFLDRAATKVRRMLERGIEAGLYRADLDVDVTTFFIAGAYDRLARQIVQAPRRPELTEMLRKVQVLLLRGIASPVLLQAVESRPKPRAVLPRPRPRTPVKSSPGKRARA
jgi:AcrR family transcriptional regulator